MNFSANTSRTLVTLVVCLVLTNSAGVAAGPSNDYRKLVDKYAEAIVTLRYVLELKMYGDSSVEENEGETHGVMIGAGGLVLCSNAKLTGFTTALQSLMGFGSAMNVSATPRDIRVLIGDDSEGLEAKLLARDSELDMAWIQINEPGKRRFKHVDFKKSIEPELGQRILSVSRMDKHFDRVVVVGEGRLAGKTKKPRSLYFFNGDLGNVLGLPVFSQAGKVVGYSVMQVPDSNMDGGRPNPLRALTVLFNFKQLTGGAILPGSDVVKATRRALESSKKASQSGKQPQK